MTEHEHAAYLFECKADLAQLVAAQRMRAAFLNQALFCRYCLFMRDLSVNLDAHGRCIVCDVRGRS